MPTLYEVTQTWADTVCTRKRRPLSKQAFKTARSYLNRRVLPLIGNLEITDVGNRALKQILVPSWERAGLAPQTQTNIFKILAIVVASYVDDEGKRLHNPEWNKDFAELPIIEKSEQNIPCFTGTEVTEVLRGAMLLPEHYVYRGLYGFLAFTGMRIGEALQLRLEDVEYDKINLHGTAFLGERIEGNASTKNHERIIPISEAAADWLAEYMEIVAEYSDDLLFPSRENTILRDYNIKEGHFNKVLINCGLPTTYGFHSFRRFRSTYLESIGTPDGVINAWMGWEGKSKSERGMISHYSHLAEWQECFEYIGNDELGFELPDWVPAIAS